MNKPAAPKSNTSHHNHQVNQHLHHAQKQLRQARELTIVSLVLLVISLLALSLGLYVARESRPAIQAQTERKSPSSTAFGQTLTNSSYSLRLANLRTDTIGNSVFKPATGNQYVIMDMTIENLSIKLVQFLPVLQTYLKDSEGKTYLLTPAPLDSPIQAGGLPPGEKFSGEVSYEVPMAASGLKLYFDPGWPGRGPAIMSLDQ